MRVNLFIFGRPGSGKSTAARHISELAQRRGWLVVHIDDYKILYRRFEADTERRRFHRTSYDGFFVIDPSVLNESLVELAGRVQKLTRPLEKEMLVIIEFARSDYRTALELFRRELLHNAYLLLLYADIDRCIQRKSLVYSTNQDNHFVSEETIRTYYSQDDMPYITMHLKTNYGLTDEKIKIINNTGTSMSFFKEVTRFAKYVFEQEMDKSRETEKFPRVSAPTSTNEPHQKSHVSQETEPIHIITTVDESTEA